MKKQKFLACMLILVLVMTAFVACGAESESLYPTDNGYSGKGEDMGFGADKDYVEDWSESVEATNPQKYDEKIIKNVNMSAETRDYDRAFAEIRSLVGEFGGYEESIKSTGRSYGSSEYYTRTAYFVLRIPASALDGFLGKVGTLVNVTSENTSVANVTAQYYDIQSRLGVLESEKQAYEEMLKKSDDINYLLQIRDRLYDVIEEIESYKTQLGILDQKVAYSTVTINLYEVIEYTEKPTKEPTFTERVGKAFTDSWEDFGDGCQNFAVWFVGAIPTFLVLAAIGGGVVAVLILFNKRAKARIAKKKQENEENK